MHKAHKKSRQENTLELLPRVLPSGISLLRILSLFAAIILPAFFTGCAHFAPSERGAAVQDLPDEYSTDSGFLLRNDRWWESFASAELNALVDQALTNNFSIQEAWARLKQADALAVQAGAARIPSLEAGGGASRTEQRGIQGPVMGPGASDETITFEDYFIGVSASYEVDLWGRIRSITQAAEVQREASREDVNAAAMTIAAEVVSRWVGLKSQQQQLRLLDEQLQANETFAELVELRYRKAMVSALDVFQQRQVLNGVQAAIPLAEARELQLQHELAVLLGMPPKTPLELGPPALPVSRPLPAIGLPADLLANRPDVRAAGLRLFAADWQVATAQADRLPALRLTARAEYSSDEISTLFDNWLTNLAGNLAGPLIDGGRRRAEVDRTRAVSEERLASYRRTVFNAVKEVEDALVLEDKMREHVAATEAQVGNAENALKEAISRYRKGVSDYIPVLTQLVSGQGLQRDLISRRTELLNARINLHRALGGSWMQELELTPAIPKG